MARKLSRDRFMRELEARGGFPVEPVIKRGGIAKWVLGNLDYSLSLEPRDDGHATWILWVGDRYFEKARRRGFGAAKVTVRPIDEALFSITADVEDVDAFAAEVGRASSFVRDREDLCQILMNEESVARGSIEAWQLPSNYPSRLAESLILSRVMGRPDIEREVIDRISAAPDANMFGKSVPALVSVRRWLKEYSRDIDISVDI
jgi:hypothetical protein